MIPSGQLVLMKGILLDLIRTGKVPQNKFAVDQSGLANGVIKYSFHLDPGEHIRILCEQFRFTEEDQLMKEPGIEDVPEEFNKATEFWKTKVGHIRFNLT